jgi:hypothetical protein
MLVASDGAESDGCIGRQPDLQAPSGDPLIAFSS